MFQVIQKLKDFKLTKKIHIEKLIAEDDVFYVKAKALLNDNSDLFVKVFSSKNKIKYSYHWQSKKKYTDHYHYKGKVFENKTPDIDTILAFIAEKIK